MGRHTISQLERELICERVKNGLRNAKLKGIHIGRKKTRPSELIRALLAKGIPYRVIASVTGTSHGSIYSEVISLRKEEEAKKKEQETLESTGGMHFDGAKAIVLAGGVSTQAPPEPTPEPESWEAITPS